MGLAKGKARVQYLACKDDLEKLLERGETFAEAHRILTQEGKISMCRASLASLYRGIIQPRANITMYRKKPKPTPAEDTESHGSTPNAACPATILAVQNSSASSGQQNVTPDVLGKPITYRVELKDVDVKAQI